MAFAETTLASACSITDSVLTVASATSIAAGRIIVCDGEIMQVTKGYVTASTQVPVLRGQLGSKTDAHVVTARIVHGDAADFGAIGAGSNVNYPTAGRTRVITSITATPSTLTLAPGGVDQIVVLNGSAAITLTIPVPTKDKDGDFLYIVNNTGAAHVPTFTGGLGGAGTNYDAVTFNATGKLFLMALACDETWQSVCAPGMGGTVTNIIGSIA